MGKKKDKTKKSTKKNNAESVMEAETDNTQPVEPGSENAIYEEYVTAEDVMALINSLEQGLDRLDKSNQLLQQRISQLQSKPQRHDGLLRLLSFILVVGILVTGYYAFRTNAFIEKNSTIAAPEVDRITTRIDAVDASIRTISSDLDNFNSSLELLSANMAAINQNVSKVAGDVSKINTGGDVSTPYNRYGGRPLDNRQQWR
jgi:prefoldin subunit 5